MHAGDGGLRAYWISDGQAPVFEGEALSAGLARVRETIHIVREQGQGRIGVAFGGTVQASQEGQLLHLASLPPLYPEWLGDRAFLEMHGLRFPYVGGAMANGITSPQMVVALARAGMLGFLGTAGLDLPAMEERLDVVERELAGTDLPFGANLIHSPHEPALEMETVELFLRRRVHRVSASAFMGLTPAVVRYAATGLTSDAMGRVVRRNHLFAKISRAEVAARFMAPAPGPILEQLVARGMLTAEEARLAAKVPVAGDLTVESDSGGHTDNRPLGALFPVIARLRDEVQRARRYSVPIRLGAAGGLGTPDAIAAAFALGASFVLTGSINQASVEAQQSQSVKEMLARAQMADVVMAPAGDMFEMGVEVQVLRRGTLFGVRARKLYEIYRTYDSIGAIPAGVRQKLEEEIFKMSLDEVWEQTRRFFAVRDPGEIARAEADPHHQLALICRWYLGLSSKWSIQGVEDRRMDYQIWMGPAQGAFNAWAKGTFLEAVDNRSVVQIALNLLEGAAVVTRAHQCRTYGVAVPAEAFDFRPRPLR